MIAWPTERPTREVAIAFFTRLLFAIYFLETGLLLVFAPFTTWWTRNLVADLVPWLHAIMASGVVRVGVVAIGLLTFAAGAGECWRLFARRSFEPAADSPGDWSPPRP